MKQNVIMTEAKKKKKNTVDFQKVHYIDSLCHKENVFYEVIYSIGYQIILFELDVYSSFYLNNFINILIK